MNPLTTRLIDLPASASALGLARIGVYATCLLMLLLTRLPVAAELPFEWFTPWGPLLLVPDFALRAVLSAPGLWAVHIATCTLCAALVLGARPFRTLAWLMVALVIVHECLSKGFNGYASHAQLALIYAIMVMAVFPCADALSVLGRARREAPATLYAAPMSLVPFVVGLTYTAVALRRMAQGGLGIDLDDTIVTYVTTRSIEYSAAGLDVGLIVHEWPILMIVMKLGYFVTTFAEIAAPLAILFGWRLRAAWLSVIVPFHFLSLVSMNIFFWENVILLLLFFTGLPHWLTMTSAHSHGAVGSDARPPEVGDIVLYDGDCGLCDGFVRWVVRHDRHARFRFAPLQGPTAARLIGSPSGPSSDWTVVLVDAEGERHERSEAALRIMAGCGGMWRVTGVLRLVPRALRDVVYRWIARNRRRWFGGAEACALPTPELRARLLP